MGPKTEFLTQAMGRSASELERFPAFLGYNLKSRIQSRYRYLQHLDHNTGCSLSFMLSTRDEEFAIIVADTSLEEYLTWRSNELGIAGEG